jgi:hypothetical protein
MDGSNDTVTVFLTGGVFFVLVVAAVLALPISFGLLRFYRRAVLRSMSARANSRTTEPASSETPAPTNQLVRSTPDISVLNHNSSIRIGPAAEAVYSDLLGSPWRAAAIYAAGGFCYALIIATVDLVSTGNELLPLRFLLWFWIYAWPVVLTVNLVAAATWRARFATSVVYFLVLAVIASVAIVTSPMVTWGQIAGAWLFINLPATVLLAAFLNRRVRAAGPLVLIFMVLAVTGSIMTPLVVVTNEAWLRSAVDIGLSLGLDSNGVIIALIATGLVVFGLAGWLTLRWIRGRYERKKSSDQSITLDAVWLLFGIVQSINLVFQGTALILTGIFAFLIYKVVTWTGFSLLGRKTPTEKSPRLLLLRVFSLGRRSERLFDALATHWRHVGSIQLIAGPDLATTTVEPHEFLDFLSRRLARRFIDGRETLERRLSETDPYPDEDGRFRVNDFFCHDDTWRMVLSELADRSDAVLMDLRGFSPQNAGCVFEIEELVNDVPLGRVVFVIDDTTDEEFLRQTVQRSWDRMRPDSPNRSFSAGQLRFFRLTRSGSGDLRHLLRALCGAAKAAP